MSYANPDRGNSKPKKPKRTRNRNRNAPPLGFPGLTNPNDPLYSLLHGGNTLTSSEQQTLDMFLGNRSMPSDTPNTPGGMSDADIHALNMYLQHTPVTGTSRGDTPITPSGLTANDLRGPQSVLPAGAPLQLKNRGQGRGNTAGGMTPEVDTSTTDTLFNQLLSMAGQAGGGTVDYENSLAESAKAIRKAYAADINAIRRGNRRARKDTKRARRQTEAAFQGLAHSYNNMGDRGMEDQQDLANQMTQTAQANANIVNQSASQQLQEQAALAQGLGIEEGMPQATADASAAAQQAVARIAETGANDATQQLAYGGSQERYMDRMAGASKMEGRQRSTDLLRDLQGYIRGNRDKIAELRGARGREIAANRQSTQQAVAEMQQQAQQDSWDRLMELAGLKMDIDQEQFDQQNALKNYQLKVAEARAKNRNKTVKPSVTMPGAENFANAQNYLGQLQSSEGVGLFDKLLNSDSMTTGYYGSGDNKVKMTPYKAMQLIEQQAEAEGLSPQDINLLRLAVWAQMG